MPARPAGTGWRVAGGRVADFTGGEEVLFGGSLCAGNPAVQRQMLEVLEGMAGPMAVPDAGPDAGPDTAGPEARADQGGAGSEKASR